MLLTDTVVTIVVGVDINFAIFPLTHLNIVQHKQQHITKHSDAHFSLSLWRNWKNKTHNKRTKKLDDWKEKHYYHIDILKLGNFDETQTQTRSTPTKWMSEGEQMMKEKQNDKNNVMKSIYWVVCRLLLLLLLFWHLSNSKCPHSTMTK